MRPPFLAAAVLVSAAAVGWIITPPTWRAIQGFETVADPAALADKRLGEALTMQHAAEEIDAALAAEDDDLAASFIELARERGIAIAPAQKDKLAELRASSGWRSLRDFGAGLALGGSDSGAGMAGALAGDVIGYGDLRDLYKEGSKVVAGESADTLVIGLAAAGLAVSAAAWTSAGAALPVRGGLTLVKTAQKAGRLSKPLAAQLTRAAAGAIDNEALGLAAAAAGRLELGPAWRAAKGVLRPAALTTFRALGQDAATLYRRTGQRGTRDVLALAENSGEIARAAKLATVKGGKTRAILKVLGRGALVAVAVSWWAASWIFSFFWYLLALALLARRLGLWLGRKMWRRRARTSPAPYAAPLPAAAPPPMSARSGKRGEFPGLYSDAPLLGA